MGSYKLVRKHFAMDRKGFKQYLIITADDFGYSEERDDGIVECFRHGVISNVSMLANGCSVVSAVEKALSAGLPMGLHLNLTEGSPVSKVPHKTLVGEDGYMLGKQGFRDALQQRLIDLNEVRQEIQSQIDRFTEVTGSKPINVDGHQHVHIIPVGHYGDAYGIEKRNCCDVVHVYVKYLLKFFKLTV